MFPLLEIFLLIVRVKLTRKMMLRSSLAGLLISFMYFYLIVHPLYIFVCTFILYSITGGWNTLVLAYHTLPRDFFAGMRFIKYRFCVRRILKKQLTIPLLFEERVQKNPNKVMFFYDKQKFTYLEMNHLTNRIANFLADQGMKKGDVVAIMMDCRPEFFALWLGVAKLGGISALVNPHHKSTSLLHSINVVKPCFVICGCEYVNVRLDIIAVANDLNSNMKYFQYGSSVDTVPCFTSLDAILQKYPTQFKVNKSLLPTDDLLYIYTSGTTGLPKAAIITHQRFYMLQTGPACAFNIKYSDIIYVPLPVYHTSGGILGAGQAVVSGSTVVLRKKFSASKYFEDCCYYKCTVGLYIGEICRYLLAQPEGEYDRKHSLRCMIGNGLRPQIWDEFVNRFQIPRMLEFYGATEGNANVMNVFGEPYAVGFISLLFPAVYPVMLIKVDEETGEIIRDKNGLCIVCKPYEPGHIVGKIIPGDPVRQFDGYLDRTATVKKVVHDVLRKGDKAFLSGDILEMDARGFLYFKDRIGDTFRWKGENVSTSEVEGVITTAFPDRDVAIYGINVPGTEGRAGMAAILDDGSLNRSLLSSVVKKLPSYARPLFVRLMPSINNFLTGTHKIKKYQLAEFGFKLEGSPGTVLFYDQSKDLYKELTTQLYFDILHGKIRL